MNSFSEYNRKENDIPVLECVRIMTRIRTDKLQNVNSEGSYRAMSGFWVQNGYEALGRSFSKTRNIAT